MKKLLALLLAVVLCLSLVACASTPKDTAMDTTPADAAKDDAADNTADDSNASEPAAEGGKNIVWAGWSGEEEASKDIFQYLGNLNAGTEGSVDFDIAPDAAGTVSGVITLNYEDASGNTVTWVGWTWADTAQQLLIRTQGGEQLDLAQADIGIFNTIAAAGVLADWNEILGEDYLKENFEQSALDVGNIDGKQLGLPWSMASITMVYNPEILAAAGWDTGRGEARQMFAQGQVAFYDDAVVAKGQAVNNGVAPEDVVKVCSAMSRPVLNAGDQPQSTMWGHMLVTFQNSEYQQEAAELAKTLVSDEIAMDYFENNGMPPVTKSMAAKDEVKNDAYLNGFLRATATARLEETARMANASEIKTIITEELQYALLGQKTAEQAVADMAARLNAL